MKKNSNPGTNVSKINPFRGLMAYEVEDSRFYYSYGYRTDDVLSKLRDNRFVTLVGDPGSGKASLVNSAIIPALLKGFAGKGGTEWSYTVFRPGTNPLKNMALALANSKMFLNGSKREPNFANHLESMLRENVQGLLNIFENELKNEHNLLIFIDDLEDLFAYKELYENDEDILLFINLILKFISRSNYPVYLVMALSSDFLSETSQYSGLRELINESQYTIPKMDSSHLGHIIDHALKSAGIKADTALIPAILQDFDTHQANNYQLQYALKSMVDQWLLEADGPGEKLHVEYYKKAGGIKGAIEQSADLFYERLRGVGDKKQISKWQRLCECLFRSITETGEINKTRAVTVKDVSELAKCSVDDVIDMINRFSYEKLELIEVIETYDIEERLESLDHVLNHPFSLVNKYSKITLRNIDLVECWPLMNEWIKNEKESARIYRRLVWSATRYKKERAREFYLRDSELEQAIEWRDRENPDEVWARRYAPDFSYGYTIKHLEDSLEEQKKEIRQKEAIVNEKLKRDRQFKYLLIIFSLVSLVLASWALIAKQEVKSDHTKLLHIKELDATRAIFIDALQDMDSAHIDQFRDTVRILSKINTSSIKEVLDFITIKIKEDSLCKRSIKMEISAIQRLLDDWTKNFDAIDPYKDRIVEEQQTVKKFCDILKVECAYQWGNLTSVHSICDEFEELVKKDQTE